MANEGIKIGVVVERKSDACLRKWSKLEGRSKRRHVAILVEKLARLFDENPEALKPIGLYPVR